MWFLLLALGLAEAQAQDREVAWSDDWRRFGTEHAILTGTTTTGLVVISVVNPLPKDRWDRPILLDAPAAAAFGARATRGATRAGHVSDAMLIGLTVWPLADAAAVGFRENTNGLSTQWALIGVQSHVLATISNRVVATATGRSRPYVARCAVEPDFLSACDSPDRYRSFFSGHTALAFSGAGLVCVNHAKVPMYGEPWDGVACGASLTAATTVGTLRMVGHRHYLSDVVVGAAIGAGVGAGLPLVLHYRKTNPQGLDGGADPRRVVPLFSVSGEL